MLKKIIQPTLGFFGYSIRRTINEGLSVEVMKEIKRLKKLDPGIPAETSIIGTSIKVPCPQTFLYLFHEIWVRKIYALPDSESRLNIIDCGANVGLATLFLKKEFPDSFITAIESDPDIFQMLEANVHQSGYSNITLVHAALTKNGEKVFFKKDRGGTGGRVANAGIEVPAIRLSNLIKGPVDFLKIDIEGAELEVLEEVEEKLKMVDRLFVEYHSVENQPQNLAALLSILEKAGFRYFCESGGQVVQQPFVENKGYKGYDNLVNIYATRV